MGTPAQQTGAVPVGSGMGRPSLPNHSQVGRNVAVPRGPPRVFFVDDQVADDARPAVM